MIKIFKKDGMWVTQQDPQDTRIVELFGTDIIPTPYKDVFNGEEVRAKIQSLNPDKKVVLICTR